MRTVSVTSNISAAKAREIGRLIVQFSTIEFVLQQVLYDLSGMDPKIGRHVARDFRSDELIKTIKKVAKVRNLNLPAGLTALSTSVESIGKERNKLAHGIWVIVKGQLEPWLRVERGEWETIESDDHVSRKDKPEAMQVTLNQLRQFTRNAADALRAAHALRKHVSSALVALREKQNEPSAESQ